MVHENPIAGFGFQIKERKKMSRPRRHGSVCTDDSHLYKLAKFVLVGNPRALSKLFDLHFIFISPRRREDAVSYVRKTGAQSGGKRQTKKLSSRMKELGDYHIITLIRKRNYLWVFKQVLP